MFSRYDAGCCIYFYFGHSIGKCSDPVSVYEEIEDAARDEIIACGGKSLKKISVLSSWHPGFFFASLN